MAYIRQTTDKITGEPLCRAIFGLRSSAVSTESQARQQWSVTWNKMAHFRLWSLRWRHRSVASDTQRLMSEPRPQLTGIGRAVTPAMWYRLGVPPVQLRPPAPLYYHRSSSSPPPTTPAATQPRRRGLDQTQPSAGSKSRRGGNPLPSADAQLDVDFSPVDVHLTPGGVVHCVFVVNQIIVLRLFDCSSSSSALIMSFDWLHCFSRLPSITMKCNHAASCRHELPNTSVLWIW